MRSQDNNCDWASEKGPSWHMYKYTISQNGKCLEFFVQYLLSVSCKMLPIKCFIDGKISLQWHQQIISYDSTNLKNVVKYYVPT